MEEIIIKEVKTRKDKKIFIYLPSKVHKNDPTWLPPIYMDEWELFNEKKNKSYMYADTMLLLAYRGKRAVGRIMGIINRRYNAIHNEQHGRFSFLECFEDQEVVHALIGEVEKWAQEKGMTALVGPLGFSDKDPQGLQIEGFEHPKFIVCPTNDKYLPEMLVREGFEKHQDLVNYLVKTPEELPLIYKKILTRVSSSNEYKIVEFKSKKELRPYIVPALELMNQTFEEIYGFVPLNDQEKKELASRYIMILDPKFIKVVETHEGLIGFAVGMPDISKAIISCKGRIFPFGILKIIMESKRSKKLLMLLGGVRKDYRGKGIDVLMAVKLMQACIDHKIELIDLHLILETNLPMRQECERIEGKIIKKFRIFKKDLLCA